MPPRDPSDPREWLRRARSNLARALLAPTAPEILYDDLCYDAQQAAEKAVKAVLVAQPHDVPRTHNLGELLDLVQSIGIAIPVDVAEARRLTRYAVGGRYPRFGEDASPDEWRDAAALAGRVVRWAAELIEAKQTPSG